jgi:hypothetical protein
MDMAGNIRHCGNYFRAATCVRQSSEWEMRDLQGSFQQLKDHFLYEERGEQKIILHYLGRISSNQLLCRISTPAPF